MSYLIDTNVFSEPAKPTPDRDVVTWLANNETELYVSAVTIGELRRGIERLRKSKRRDRLEEWLVGLCACMQGRVLSFNASVAHVWGQLKAKWEIAGVSIPSIDSQIAATAHRHSLILVTRNEKDFKNSGIKLLNPFAI